MIAVRKPLLLAVLAAPLLFTAGCATRSSVELAQNTANTADTHALDAAAARRRPIQRRRAHRRGPIRALPTPPPPRAAPTKPPASAAGRRPWPRTTPTASPPWKAS